MGSYSLQKSHFHHLNKIHKYFLLLIGIHICRSNTPTSSPSQYFLRTISIPMLDHLLQELETRFDDSQRTTLQGFCLIPSIMVSMDLEIVLSKLGELENMHSSDLPYVSSLKVRDSAGILNGETRQQNMELLLFHHLCITHSHKFHRCFQT